MLDKIQELLGEVDAVVVNSKDDLEKFRIKYISRKGILNDLFEEFKTVANEQKRAVGQELNKLKNEMRN